MDDAEQRLARIVCAAIEEVVGDPAKARLLLSAEFRKARDFDLALALYQPYLDAALESV